MTIPEVVNGKAYYRPWLVPSIFWCTANRPQQCFSRWQRSNKREVCGAGMLVDVGRFYLPSHRFNVDVTDQFVAPEHGEVVEARGFQ